LAKPQVFRQDESRSIPVAAVIQMGTFRVPFALAGVFALGASLALAVLLFVCVPVGQDGTWYSYPGYAWSQGGDPSENIPLVMRQNPPPQREVAKFGWENRGNLIVALTRAWFGVFSPSWVTLKEFGIVQLVALAFLAAAVARNLTGDWTLTIFSACIVLSDARILEQALASARPDLFISVFSVALLWLLLIGRGSGNSKAWIGVVILAVCLPMLHSTAANAIALLVAFLGLLALADRLYFESSRLMVWGAISTALLLIVYFGKQPILDVLIPTHVPLDFELPYRHDMVQELKRIVHAGLAAKVSMELNRWRDYFFFGNVAQFLTITTGVISAVILFKRRRQNPAYTSALALFIAFLCAVGSLFLFDSHPMVPHALVLAVFGYLGSASLLGAANQGGLIGPRQMKIGCVTILVVAGAVNLLHAGRLYRDYWLPNVTNAAEQAALLRALPATGDVRVIGPTEIWPYLAQRRQPLILIDDDRARFSRIGGNRPEEVDPNYAGAGYVVVNKELFATWQWDRMIDGWINQHLIVKISELGDCTRTVECLRIYAFVSHSHTS
jgi:hypothetical protein